MYTSLNGMTPLTNAPKVAYDVAGLGSLWGGLKASRRASPGPTRGFKPDIVRHQGNWRPARPLTGLGDFDFGGIISSAISAASNVGTSLIQGHYGSTTPLSAPPASVIPGPTIQYLPTQSSNKPLIIGGVAVAALVATYLIMKRKRK